MLWTLVVAALVGGFAFMYAQSNEIKKLESLTAKLSARVHELQETVGQVEGLKPGDRAAIDAVHEVMFRDRLHKILKETGTESLLS